MLWEYVEAALLESIGSAETVQYSIPSNSERSVMNWADLNVTFEGKKCLLNKMDLIRQLCFILELKDELPSLTFDHYMLP